MVLRLIFVTFFWLLCEPSVGGGQSVDPPPQPNSIGEEITRLDSLEDADARQLKQQLLAELFDRVQTATKITLRDAPPYERLRLQGQSLQTPDQRQFTAKQLRELWQQVDHLEKEVIKHLARKYRIEIYNTFRTQRSTYDRRLLAWNRVEKQWQQVGRQVDDQPAMIRWLDEAIAASREGKVSRLPTSPDFLASRIPPRSDVPHGTQPASDIPRPRTEPPIEKIEIAHAPQRVKSLDLPTERPENIDRLPIIVHVDPPLLTDVPLVRTADSSADVDGSKALVRRRPTLLSEVLAINSTPTGDERPADVPAVESHDTDRINLTEIQARVAGYALSLAALREKLEDPRPWTAARLAPLVELIDELATRHADLQLYQKVVPIEYRGQISAMTSPSVTAALLARRIAEARNHLARPSDAARLDEFSRRITKLLQP